MAEMRPADRVRLIRNATVSAAVVGGVVCGAVGFVVATVVAMGDAARSR
ncbi:hypothetical protein [Rhodococcoides trifolii]|nr:hypothetical protein [Rhodococcus trifolii]